MGEALAPTRGRHTQTPPRMKHKKTTMWRRARNSIRPQNIKFSFCFDFKKFGRITRNTSKIHGFRRSGRIHENTISHPAHQKNKSQNSGFYNNLDFIFSAKHTKHRQNQWFSRIGSHSQNEDFTKTFKNYYKTLDFTEIVILKIMAKCRKHKQNRGFSRGTKKMRKPNLAKIQKPRTHFFCNSA